MSVSEPIRKITISLPEELVAFADDRARTLSMSRSRVISLALAAVKTREDQLLAANGYLFYAQEASEFAQATQHAIAETWTGDWQPTDLEGAEHDSQAR